MLRRLFSTRAAKEGIKSATSSVPSYAHGTSSTPLLFETIGARFRSKVEAVPDKTLYVFDHQQIRKTYAEAYADTRKLACALLELGLSPGDRIGIWGPNYYEWVTCQMATAIGGFIQVNINPSYQTEELRFALEKVGIRAVITPREFKKSNYYRTLKEVIPSISGAKEGCGLVKRNRNLPDLQHLIMFGQKEKTKGFWSYDDLMAGVGSTSDARLREYEHAIRIDDPVNIQYTSGTTGYPKAATLTHHSLLNNSYFQGVRSEYDKGNHILCIPNPLYHCFASTMGVLNAMSHGQTTVFPDAGFNALRTLEVIARERCTSLYGTPTMFIDILDQLDVIRDRGLNVASLNAGYIAGAPCPVVLCDRMVNELGMRNLEVLYGSTELSPVVTMSLLSQPPQHRIKNVGYAMDHVELLIIDEDGQVVPRGEKGELLARGYCLMRGYYNDEERTRKDITPDRWYHTGYGTPRSRRLPHEGPKGAKAVTIKENKDNSKVKIAYSKIEGDVVAAAYAHELPGFGIKAGLTNYAASNATGLLLARRHLKNIKVDQTYKGLEETTGEFYNVEKEGDASPFKAVLDTGLSCTTTGAKIFAVMKGVADGGIDVPHSENRFFGYDGESKNYNAEAHRDRIFGKHVGEYMNYLKEEDEEDYKRQFSKFIAAGIASENIEETYKKAHAAICANPDRADSKEKKVEKKRHTAKKLTFTQRKGRVASKKAHLLRLKAQMEAQ